MSFHHERGEHQRISTFAVFGLFFYVVLGIVLLPLLLAAAPAMARFLRLLPICMHSSQTADGDPRTVHGLVDFRHHRRTADRVAPA
jgi:hypothetical protein